MVREIDRSNSVVRLLSMKAEVDVQEGIVEGSTPAAKEDPLAGLADLIGSEASVQIEAIWKKREAADFVPKDCEAIMTEVSILCLNETSNPALTSPLPLAYGRQGQALSYP
jgi:hypothetical protein